MVQGQNKWNMLGKKDENSFYFTIFSIDKVICALVLIMVLIPVSLQAKVSGPCSNCHTMHNSQNGSPVARGDEPWGGSGGTTESRSNLLVASCLGCHSSTDTEAVKDLPGGFKVPIVFNTSGYPTPALAGGNFYYVSLTGADNDAKGHNIFSADSNLNAAPGNTTGCLANNSCHENFNQPFTQYLADSDGLNLQNKYSCEGCHLRPKHHLDDHDHLQGGKVTTAAQGWYRFLSGHMNGLGYPHGVEGYEDGDWQYTSGANNHNEYFAIEKNNGTGLRPDTGLGHTVTGFCSGCHGVFRDQTANSPFIRHPADVAIDNTVEYTNAFGAGGSGTGTYDPLIPVGRPVLPDAPDPQVHLGTDMVMCLSCHRAHGSENFKMLRWDYKGWPASGEPNYCAMCHTSKQ